MTGASERKWARARRQSPDPRGPPDPAQILAALPIPVALIDRDNRFRFVNYEAEEFFRSSAAQLAESPLSDLVPRDSPLFLLIEQVRRAEAAVSEHDIRLDSTRLNKRGVTVHAAPLPEEPGAVLLVLQDASAARALGRQLSFRNAARSVAGMAAILAHEVRNPLSGIRGAAQLLEATAAGPDRELAELIRDEADRIRGLVDRVEVFGQKAIERGLVNIHRVLEYVRRLAQSGFAAHIRFAEHYDPSLPPVWGNRDQLVQVMLNLVKNATEAIGTNPGSDNEIVLSTGFQHGMRLALPGSPTRVDLPLVVCVRDNGPGIPEDIQQHLFEPFVTSKPSGSGLGLALVAKVIGDHGGLIQVDSRPGRTEFQLYLPVFPEDERR
ncbi:MAG: PAS domain-containing protein [Acetobacteraceae bacterium]|nr:PAS domain-containing protein [Acetobacteraceae bacterium]